LGAGPHAGQFPPWNPTTEPAPLVAGFDEWALRTGAFALRSSEIVIQIAHATNDAPLAALMLPING